MKTMSDIFGASCRDDCDEHGYLNEDIKLCIDHASYVCNFYDMEVKSKNEVKEIKSYLKSHFPNVLVSLCISYITLTSKNVKKLNEKQKKRALRCEAISYYNSNWKLSSPPTLKHGKMVESIKIPETENIDLRKEVEEIYHYQKGEHDSQHWIILGKLNDKSYFKGCYFQMDSWCDLTGFDCQSEGKIILFNTFFEMARD